LEVLPGEIWIGQISRLSTPTCDTIAAEISGKIKHLIWTVGNCSIGDGFLKTGDDSSY
jgi:hypothetical protein